MKKYEQQYKEVRDEITKANPSILDLRFGCEIDDLGKRYFLTENTPNSTKDWFTSDRRIVSLEMLTQANHTEIIGRKITLEDCLIALREKRSHEFHTADVPTTMKFGKEMDLENKKLLSLWEMGKDLANQSKETISFLYQLLKVK